MRHLLLASSLTALVGLSACEEPRPEPRAEEMVVVEPAAPAAEDSAAPAVEQAPVTEAPPSEALPPESRTSEQTVQPDSETLFY